MIKNDVVIGSILSLCLICLPFKKIFSQVDSGNYKVIYQGYVNFGKSKEISSRGTLFLNGSKSFFYSEFLKEFNPPNTDSTKVIISKEKGSIVYKDFMRERLIFQSLNVVMKNKNDFYVDSLYLMKWTLVSERKKIDSYNCRKAFCKWRGRSYVAWYCPDVFIPNGPWKFGGLPGLIMEIEDETKSVFWTLYSIEHSNEKFQSLSIEPVGNYSDFKKSFNVKYNKLVKSMTATEQADDPSCVSCKTTVKIKIQTIENLIDY